MTGRKNYLFVYTCFASRQLTKIFPVFSLLSLPGIESDHFQLKVILSLSNTSSIVSFVVQVVRTSVEVIKPLLGVKITSCLES